LIENKAVLIGGHNKIVPEFIKLLFHYGRALSDDPGTLASYELPGLLT